MTELLGFMQTIYTGTQICVDKSYDACDGNQVLWERTHFKYPKFEENEVEDQKAKENQEAGKICLFGEPDMEQIMTKGNYMLKVLKLNSGKNNNTSLMTEPLYLNLYKIQITLHDKS